MSSAGERWSLLAVIVNSIYLFPVKVLSELFRGKFLDAFTRAYDQGDFDRDPGVADLADRRTFRQLKDTLYRKDWVVYAKRPFGGPEQVFNYLGRYTHRVAISNRRLLAIDDSGIRFATKNGKTAVLPPQEFIRRFLLHVLPKGFVKIRHFGLMVASNATTKLDVARSCLEAQQPSRQPIVVREDGTADSASDIDWRQRLKNLTGIDLSVCPRCQQGEMLRYPLLDLERVSSRRRPALLDSS